MSALKWIWWFGGPLFSLICIGYAIGFIGSGFSLWSRPEPDGFILTIVFILAALAPSKVSVEEFIELLK